MDPMIVIYLIVAILVFSTFLALECREKGRVIVKSFILFFFFGLFWPVTFLILLMLLIEDFGDSDFANKTLFSCNSEE